MIAQFFHVKNNNNLMNDVYIEFFLKLMNFDPMAFLKHMEKYLSITLSMIVDIAQLTMRYLSVSTSVIRHSQNQHKTIAFI